MNYNSENVLVYCLISCIALKAFCSHCISCMLCSPALQTVVVHFRHLATLSPAFRVALSARHISTIHIPCHCSYICNPYCIIVTVCCCVGSVLNSGLQDYLY